jgi:leucyl/phenylalanyl-tRNA--protein transferase
MTAPNSTNFGIEELIACYEMGIFPMSDNRDDPGIFLVEPEMRGIIPLDGLHISRSMRKIIRRGEFSVSYDMRFREVIKLCAQATTERQETWINHGIEYLYGQLHDIGKAHSVEVWRENQLVGGLYGVSIGAAFFGESMFSRATNASKFALIKLVERLNDGGYELLDTQFITPHLTSLGAIEITKEAYQIRLKQALKGLGSFHPGKNSLK